MKSRVHQLEGTLLELVDDLDKGPASRGPNHA
jgi:hypothetical protein